MAIVNGATEFERERLDGVNGVDVVGYSQDIGDSSSRHSRLRAVADSIAFQDLKTGVKPHSVGERVTILIMSGAELAQNPF